MVIPFQRRPQLHQKTRERAWRAISARALGLIAAAPEIFDWLVDTLEGLLDQIERRLRGSDREE